MGLRVTDGRIGRLLHLRVEDLPRPGKARPDLQDLKFLDVVPPDEPRHLRPRADKRHVPAQDVDELRKLVKLCAPQPAADARYARIRPRGD
jgi:hypothetical protein